MSSVEVQIELAHKASPRAKPTEEGYTHDWCVYVRGIDGCNIQYFVEKVVFQLHESFPKPRRVLKEPPYEISESGYAGFELPIEIYFRNKEEPKKVNYTYDLFLRIGDTCQNSQKEKLTFQNPNAEFKKKLLKAGGVIHEKVSDSPSRSLPLAFGDDKHSHKSSKSISRDGPGEKKKSSKMASVIPSKDKSLHSQQSSSNQGQSLSTSSSSHHSQISSYHEKSVNSSSNIPPPSSTHSQSPSDPFTDLFGTPIKTRPSPDPVHSKLKNNGGSGTSKTALSGLKSSSKKISSSDIKSSSGLITKSSEKEKKHKIIPNGGIVSSKDIKTEKDAKPSKEKSLKKRDESPKIKKEKHSKPTSDGRPTTPNLSASSSSKKSSSSLPSLTSVKKESADVGGNISKDSNLSSSKKRKRSLSPPSFLSGEIGDKKESGTLTKLSTKDGLTEKSHKEKSKKQKASSKDQVSTSATVGSNSNHKVKDVKKESSTSTTISLTNNENTGTTTLEIKSVKKEKTWDSEVKKSRSKEHKTDEVKSSRENVSKDINKVQVRDKEVVKEKEKEQPLLPEKKEKEKDKDKERSKDKSSKNRDREREKDKSKSRSKDKGNINEDSISPKDKYSKIPKDKYIGTTVVNNNNNLSANVNSLRDSSSSPASIVSGSLTPGGGAFIGAPSSVSSLNGPIKTLMDEMDQESLPVSPLSSCDPPSPLTFGSKDKDSSSDGENNSYSHPSTVNKNLNPIKLSHYANHKPDITVREEPRPQIPRNVNPAEKSKNREFPPNIPSSKKRKETTSNAKPTEPTEPMNEPDGHRSPKPAISRGTPTTFDLEYINQLKVLHRKINDLRDRDVLQRIVDIIEETGLFNMTNTAFDFDLMQLDRNTVRKIRQCLIST